MAAQIVTTPEDLAAALTARRRVLAGHQSDSEHGTHRDEVAFPANLTRELLLSRPSTAGIPTAPADLVQFAENRTRPSLIAWLEL